MASTLLRTLKRSTALVPATLLATLIAHANPQNGQVVQGAATITAPDPSTLNIQQQTDKAIINWQSFDIGVGETTQFFLPSKAGVTLNRVVGGDHPSQILGTLKSNGTVMVINPDGILFGPNSVVDVGGLLATTSDIEDNDFMAGNYRFSKPGNPSASIVNQGTITAKDEGVAALVAPGVRNEGIIAARLGKVTLGAANQFTLDLYGDDLINLVLTDELTDEVFDLATGKPLADRVSNTGKISADGGTVVLKAATARKVVNSVINNTGVIEANSVGMKNGKIVLSAATAKTKKVGAPVQKVKVSGTLTASGTKPGEKGGLIAITGEQIELLEANAMATGEIGGGTVLIGGDYLGGNATDAQFARYGIEREVSIVPTASNVTVDANSTINANANSSGNGGKVVLWSDDTTYMWGRLVAKGGVSGGDGGFIETSGKESVELGQYTPDASAISGLSGTWVLDPAVINLDTIQEQIQNALNSGTSVSLSATDEIFATSLNITKTTATLASLDLTSDLISLSNSTITSPFGSLSLWLYANQIRIENSKIDLPGDFSLSNNFLEFTAGLGPTPVSDKSIHIINSNILGPDGSTGMTAWYGGIYISESVVGGSPFVDFATEMVISKSRILGTNEINFEQNCAIACDGPATMNIVDSEISTHLAVGGPLEDGVQIGFSGSSTLGKINIAGSTISAFNADVDIWSTDPIISSSSLFAQNGSVFINGIAVPNTFAATGSQNFLNPEANLSLHQAMLDYFNQLSAAACLAGTGICGPLLTTTPILPATFTPSGEFDTLNLSGKSLNKLAAGTVAGTMTVKLQNGTTKTLVSYGNGENYGTPDGEYQCVDLIVEYAKLLGLASIASTRDLMDGKDNAINFYELSNGKFSYSANGTVDASQLPKDGAVLSIDAYNGNQYGHVGIVTDAHFTDSSQTVYVVTLFDQNWPSEQWKVITFTKQGDRWLGTMPNSKTGPVQVGGWANPVS